jgi:hypothetical protein
MPSGLSISSGPNRFYDLHVGPKLAPETSWLHFKIVRDGVRPEKQQYVVHFFVNLGMERNILTDHTKLCSS